MTQTAAPKLPFEANAVLQVMQDAAERELLPRFGNLAKHEIREKKPGDLVTVADEAMEKALAESLQRLLPGATVVGEEIVAADPGFISHIASDEWAWIVDPLDGTHNFAHGKDIFAVIVALTHRGSTVGGWIYDPLGRAGGHALRGQGAWLDGRRRFMAKPAALKDLLGYVGFRVRHEMEQRAGDRLARIGKTSSLFCAGREYLEVLAGNRHFNLYRRIKPWDHAAGALMVEEAGGHAARFDGQPYLPTDREGGLISAPDRQSWQAIHDIFLADPPLPVSGR